MSAQTQVYLFNLRQQVVLLEPGASIATRRYDIVYAKELTIVKGVDNLLEFAFINQDQKPVNLTGKVITARILSSDGRRVLVQKTLSSIYPITGLMSLELTALEIENIDVQKAFYSLSSNNGTNDYPVFVDAQGASRGSLNIVNGVMPTFTPSMLVTVPTHPPVVSGSPVTYYSSTIPTLNQSSFSVQVTLDQFTGTIQLVGSVTSDFALQYDITTIQTFTDITGTEGFSVDGYHPYVRLKIENTSVIGDVTEILYR